MTLTARTGKRRPRWGLRLIGSLGLATVGLFVAIGQGYHTFGTVAAIVAGLFAALVSTIFGWRSMVGMSWWDPSRRDNE